MENNKKLTSDYSNLIIGPAASGKTWRTAELIKDTIDKDIGAIAFDSLGLKEALAAQGISEDRIITVDLSNPEEYAKFSFNNIAGSFCSKEYLKQTIYTGYNEIIQNAGDLANEKFPRKLTYLMYKMAKTLPLLNNFLSFKEYINFLVDADMLLLYEDLFNSIKEKKNIKAETFEDLENEEIYKAYCGLKEELINKSDKVKELKEKIYTICPIIPKEIIRTTMDDAGFNAMEELKKGNVILIHFDSEHTISIQNKLMLDFETLLLKAFSMQSILEVKFNVFIDDNSLCHDDKRLTKMMYIPIQMQYILHDCNFNLTVYPYTDIAYIKHFFLFKERIIKLKDDFDFDVLWQTEKNFY